MGVRSLPRYVPQMEEGTRRLEPDLFVRACVLESVHVENQLKKKKKGKRASVNPIYFVINDNACEIREARK